MIFELASFLIAAFAFGAGAAAIFQKKKPLYFQLLVSAAGCFALERLSSVVNLWCSVYESFGIGMLGVFGCNFFLLSANFGTLDKIVDDGTDSKKARALAFFAPAVTALLTLGVFLVWQKQSLVGAAIWALLLLPALPASYFNLKHLLLPEDPFGFLAATKRCNYAAIGFYIASAAYGAASALSQTTLCGIFAVLTSLTVLALVLASIKGVKQWGI